MIAHRCANPVFMWWIALCTITAVSDAQDRVSDTVHNLSVSGPGSVRAIAEQQVCVFCHASHTAGGIRPLWNREMPLSSYKIYQSSTLDAKPGQPTGSSKLCLSCHDGTIALGSVLNRSDQIRMSGGDFLPAGLTNLGTDLSDDHPISFHYTSGLSASDRQLAYPANLPQEVRLDATGQLQCTTCHDPHSNRFERFLVLSGQFGELCTACHVMQGWESCAHRTAGASVAGSRETDWPHATVAENACRSCHRSHTAGGKERLLIFEQEEENCLQCHDGTVARTDILSQLDKRSAHDPRRYLDIHDPVESAAVMQAHVECADCHNPHAVGPAYRSVAYMPIGETLALTRGVAAGGAAIDRAQYEYEVCFRCHGDSAVRSRRAPSRQSQTANLRLRFSPSSESYHPVVLSTTSRDTVSLAPNLAPGSLIACTDCHSNDDGPGAGGGGPPGPHGSNFDFLLERNYTVRDDNSESEYEYAMCYKCHQRSSILSDQSFPFHVLHIVDQRSPCSACHDPHGVTGTVPSPSDHTHLINFDLQIVRPVTGTRRLVFRDLGQFTGSCTLQCHGREHVDETYGQFGMP
ncbi:MAG: hypothetical protein JSV78_08165 [Phycisphaerales bacterium]|nr:MAG: hypothetical protein JSV78_08165 [Phycisphaerales bacterium]